MLNKSYPLSRYKANSGKNIKKKCLMHFDSDAFCSCQLTQNTTFWQMLLSNRYLFYPIFSIIDWTNRLHNFDEEICFPDNCYY